MSDGRDPKEEGKQQQQAEDADAMADAVAHKLAGLRMAGAPADEPQQQQQGNGHHQPQQGQELQTAAGLPAMHTAAGLPANINAAQLQMMLQGGYAYGQGAEQKTHDDYKFWKTQPVPRLDEDPEENGPIEVKTVAEVRQEPYKLPEGFAWCEVDMGDAAQAKEAYDLLNRNYVEDDDSMFRFDYSPVFLEWALTPPGHRREFVVGIRVAAKAGAGPGKLVGFITGVPVDMRVYDKTMPMVEINFLCVLKKLRSKRLAPVLIKEITRRVNLTNVWQAVYTAGVVLPKPVGTCQYFHRLLKPKKLVEIGFTRLGPRMNMARMVRLYQLPDAPASSIRPMTVADVPSARELLNAYLAKFKLAPVMSEEDFAHWLLPRPEVVDSFVVVDPATGRVTDLCSFYHLPSTVIRHDKHDKLTAVYSFYNVATSMPLGDLMKEALILAKARDVDVFNALDVMENSIFLSKLKFGPGDGRLQYYVYNWKCPSMQAADVGLVLL